MSKIKNNGLSRRQFLGGALALGAGVAFSNPFSKHGIVQQALAGASSATDRYFIFCYFSGGWDLLISLDPRDPAVFREDLKKVTRIQPAYQMLPAGRQDLVHSNVPGMTFGPFIGNLVDHADKMSVVRGISMDTLTHEVGRRRFLTGKQPAGLQARGSSLATIISGQVGNDTPIPNLSVRVEAYNVDQPDYASAIRVTSVTDLIRALRTSDTPLSPAERQAINELFASSRECPIDASSPVRQRGFDSSLSAQDLVGRGLSPLFDFGANTPEMGALRDHYGIDADDLTSGAAQAAMAVTALEAGISRCVSIEVTNDLDAHGPTWAAGHGPKLETGFNLVAAIVEDLAARQYMNTGDSWLDHTTVVCFSEFSRTPLVNASGGRDHSLMNACLLMGAGIRGGQVVGQSSDLGMAPQPVDLETGVVDANAGTIIKPEHIHRALLESIGITDDIVEWRAEPLRAVLA
jgi:uncharacterized protein (DUF1501 family)